MGKHEGKKGLNALDAFNTISRALGDSATILAAQTLLTRTLGEKHFSAIINECRRISDAHIMKLWESTDARASESMLANRRIGYNLIYFSPDRNDPQLYQVRTDYVRASYEKLDLADRALPVLIDSQHVEERYLNRVAAFVKNPETLIPFEKESFVGTLIVGATMAMALSLANRDQPNKLFPVFVPDTLGAYLGYGTIYPQDGRGYASSKVTAHHDLSGAGRHHFAISGDYEGNMRRPPTEPLSDTNCVLRLRTFVGLPELKPNQKMLHRAFLPIIEQASQPVFVANFIIEYARGMLGCNNEFTPHFRKLFDNCVKIMASDAYKQEMILAMPSLNDYLKRQGNPQPPIA